MTESDEDDEDEDEPESTDVARDETTVGDAAKTLTPAEQALLQRLVAALQANQDRDPKYNVVLDCLRTQGWLDLGCIVFSQYRDSVWWLAQQLTQEFPRDAIGLYSSPASSGIMLGGQ